MIGIKTSWLVIRNSHHTPKNPVSYSRKHPQVWGTHPGVQNFYSFQKGKMFVPTCFLNMGMDICLYCRELSRSSAGSEPGAVPGAAAPALQRSDGSRVKLPGCWLGDSSLFHFPAFVDFPPSLFLWWFIGGKYNSKMNNWYSFKAISFTLLVLLIYSVYSNWWQKPIVLLKH